MLPSRSVTKKRPAASPATVDAALAYKAKLRAERLQVDCLVCSAVFFVVIFLCVCGCTKVAGTRGALCQS
eukprot:1395452-Amphidinium_carterae.1